MYTPEDMDGLNGLVD